MTDRARPVAKAVPLPMTMPGLVVTGVALLLMTAAALAQEGGEVTVSHGVSTFGELKYGPDFERLDYVNPDAPKGGEISLSWDGTFDSFNPYTRKT